MIYLLVNTDSKNKYSVYDMIPLSLSVRKSCEDPFFNPGTLSRISSKSILVIKCLWSRARKKNTRSIYIMHALFSKYNILLW